MAKTHETIADIIAEMRRGTRLPGYWRSCDVNAILQYHADRLEAAHKRELARVDAVIDEAVHGYPPEDIYDKRERGDCAKLREALVQAELFVGNIVRHGHQTLVPGDKCTACDGAEELRDMICAALSAPPRNCDVGTAEEQVARYHAFCAKMMKQNNHCCGPCPCHEFINGEAQSCTLLWAQMPYEEGGDK